MASASKGIKCRMRVCRGEKFFVANCPDFRITTQGKTVSDALKNLNEALRLCLDDGQWRKFYGISIENTTKPLVRPGGKKCE